VIQTPAPVAQTILDVVTESVIGTRVGLLQVDFLHQVAASRTTGAIAKILKNVGTA